MREKLVNAIIENSSDELDIKDVIEIAKESEEQLFERLIYILNFYSNEYNKI